MIGDLQGILCRAKVTGCHPGAWGTPEVKYTATISNNAFNYFFKNFFFAILEEKKNLG